MKRTYQAKKLKRLRKFGFLSRKSSKGGRGVLRNRRASRRWKLAA